MGRNTPLYRAVYGVDLVRESVLACMRLPSEVGSVTGILDHEGVGARHLLAPLPGVCFCDQPGVHVQDAAGSIVPLRRSPNWRSRSHREQVIVAYRSHVAGRQCQERLGAT